MNEIYSDDDSLDSFVGAGEKQKFELLTPKNDFNYINGSSAYGAALKAMTKLNKAYGIKDANLTLYNSANGKQYSYAGKISKLNPPKIIERNGVQYTVSSKASVFATKKKKIKSKKRKGAGSCIPCNSKRTNRLF